MRVAGDPSAFASLAVPTRNRRPLELLFLDRIHGWPLVRLNAGERDHRRGEGSATSAVLVKTWSSVGLSDAIGIGSRKMMPGVAGRLGCAGSLPGDIRPGPEWPVIRDRDARRDRGHGRGDEMPDDGVRQRTISGNLRIGPSVGRW